MIKATIVIGWGNNDQFLDLFGDGNKGFWLVIVVKPKSLWLQSTLDPLTVLLCRSKVNDEHLKAFTCWKLFLCYSWVLKNFNKKWPCDKKKLLFILFYFISLYKSYFFIPRYNFFAFRSYFLVSWSYFCLRI